MEKIDLERGKRLGEVFNYLVETKRVKTQKDFAEKIGCTPGQISKAMKGSHKDMTPGLIRKVCSTFGGVFEEKYLLDGKGKLLKEQLNEIIIQSDERKVDYSIYKEALDKVNELTGENAVLRHQLSQQKNTEKEASDKIEELTRENAVLRFQLSQQKNTEKERPAV